MKEIVIKIPDEVYEKLFTIKPIDLPARNVIAMAIRDGKVLPKGHGRIGDLDKFEANFNEKCAEECGCCSYSEKYGCGLFKDAETLIEANKEEKDD